LRFFYVHFYKTPFKFPRVLIYFFTNIPLIIMYFFHTIWNKYTKETLIHSLSLSLSLSLKDKIVKAIPIINKFNITINFLNLHIFLKRILYLEIEHCYLAWNFYTRNARINTWQNLKGWCHLIFFFSGKHGWLWM
jgi:hypothetical protein